MDKKIVFALLVTLASIGVHFHLTLHWYPLHFGAPVESAICNLGSQFNCDVAAASPYGNLFGIPVSLWGAVTHIVLALFLLGALLRFTDHPGRLLSFAFLLGTVALGASVVMGAISTFFLSAYCPLCIVLYGLSLVNFELLRRAQTEPFFSTFFQNPLRLWAESPVSLGSLAAVPLLSLLIHVNFTRQYDAQHLEKVLQQAIFDWSQSPLVSFAAEPSLSKGPQDAAMVVAEFADFRCIHCQRVAPVLKTLTQVHRDVRVDFYAFPLDGTCNPGLPEGDGVSCRYAKATVCSEQIGQKGWEMHDTLFDRFERISSARAISAADEVLERISEDIGLNWPQLFECIEDPETLESIMAQASAGQRARVRGTPAIFVNGRLAPGSAQNLAVLQGLRRHLR